MPIRVGKKHVVLSGVGLCILGCAMFVVMGQTAGPINCFMVPMPPVQYDYEPTRPFRRIAVSHFDLDATCRERADFSYVRARLESCVIIAGGDAVMYVPNDVDRAYRACLVRHENGHINGWGYDHRGSRFYPIAAPASDRYSRNSTYGY